jgi:hypothetical protein
MAMRKVRPGEPLRLEASTWNAFVDAAAAHQAARHALRVAGPDGAGSQALVWVRNDSGADRARFELLGLGDPLFAPDTAPDEFQSRVCLKGVALVAADHRQSFCVLQEPVASGEMGLGLVWGVTPCQVDVRLATDAFAGVTTAEYGKLSGGDGGAQILWKESGTGTKWAVVLVGSAWNERRFELTSPLSAGDSASAKVRRHNGTTWITTTEPFEVFDAANMFSGETGWIGLARWYPDSKCWEIYQLQCPG